MSEKQDEQDQMWQETRDAAYALDRPVSQDAQEVAREIGAKIAPWLSCEVSLEGFHDTIARALQSHADAARVAERKRIREAVWNLYADHEGALMPLRFVLAAIDGQPLGGGGE